MSIHKQKLKKIAGQLNSISKAATKSPETDESHFAMHDGVSYSLPKQEAIAFNEITQEILRHCDFSRKFSSKYIDSKLKKILASILKGEQVDAEAALKILVDELACYKNNCKIYLKIDGIIATQKIHLGNITLLHSDENNRQDLKVGAAKIIETVKATKENKEKYLEEINKKIDAELNGGCIAVVEVSAEPIRAYEIAKEEAGRVIDLLRLTSTVVSPPSEDIRIGLKGDYPSASREGFVLSDESLHTKTDNLGSRLKLKLDNDTLTLMKETGILKISDALKKDQATNLEETLIKSIHWFSVAHTQSESGNELLCLIIALECLFQKEAGNSISGTVAESVALIIAKDLKARKEIIKLVRDSYGKRSAVAHGGNKIVSDADVNMLRSISIMTIFKVIEKLKEFTSQKQLMTWIEEIKLS